MKSDLFHTIKAVESLKKGGVIAYPTESIYGLGCAPLDQAAIEKLLRIKQRPVNKGLILIASNLNQLKPFIQPLHRIGESAASRVISSWPGPYTWILPAKKWVPSWLTGEHRSIAVRITNHLTAKNICERFNSPIVSTSSNRHMCAPTKTHIATRRHFHDQIDYILPGRIGIENKPSQIRNAITGDIIR